MISPSPRNYAYVEAVRPVLDGRDYLSRAKLIGLNVLGDEIVSSVDALVVSDLDDSYPQNLLQRTVIPTTEPRMSVADRNDLSFVLTHRSIPKELASRYQFGYAAGKLNSDSFVVHQTIQRPDGKQQRAKVTLPSLTQIVDQKSTENGIEPKATPLYCGQIEQLDVPGRDIILGLVPDPHKLTTRVLMEQADAVDARLSSISERIAGLPSQGRLRAPIARVPGNVGSALFNRLVDELTNELPPRFTLGPVEYRSTN